MQTGYAPVEGGRLYYERHGEGKPLILLHGGFGLAAMFAPILPALAAGRQVIGVDLEGHGHTPHSDAPFSWDRFADQIAALCRHLRLEKADLMGYSLGGGVALRTAIRHADLVDRLVLVSTAHRSDAWYPEMVTGMRSVSAAAAEAMKASPMYEAYAAAAPDPAGWGRLADRTGALLRQDYDWSEEIRRLAAPVLLVYGDADGIPPRVAAEFYELLGGGLRDAGWDGSGMARSRLAILPGVTHYDIFMKPALAATVGEFLQTGRRIS